MWDDFVTASDDAWLFHLSDWMAIESERAESFAFSVQEGTRLIAVFPLYMSTRRYGGVIPSRVLHTGRGRAGPAFHPELEVSRRTAIGRDMFSHIDGVARRHGVDRVEVRLPTLAPNHLPPLRPNDDPLTRYFTPVQLKYGRQWTPATVVDKIVRLDRCEDDLFSDLDRDCRNAVRKAKKNGVAVVEATRREDMDEYHRLHIQTLGRSGGHGEPLSSFQTLWDRFGRSGRMAVLFAEEGGRRIGAIILLCFREAVTYWAGASDRSFQHLRPNNLLLWEALRWAKQRDFRWFEVGPVFPFGEPAAKATAIGRFKDQFGGERFGLYEGAKNYRPLRVAALEMADAAIDAARRFARAGSSS